jgi:TolA-binding protein
MSEQEEEAEVASFLSDSKRDPILGVEKWLKKNNEKIEHLMSQYEKDKTNTELEQQINCIVLKQQEVKLRFEDVKNRIREKQHSDLKQLYGINDNNTTTTMTVAGPIEPKTQEQRIRESIRRMEEEGDHDDRIIKILGLSEHEKTWLSSQQKQAS